MMRRMILLLFGLVICLAQDYDQFTYRDYEEASSNPILPPPQWMDVRCENLEACVGWPEKFLAAPDWRMSENACRWCPASGNDCGTHHQSPINLERNRAIEDSESHNPCVDVHLMHRADSSCTFDELVRLNAFSIERYALQIKQPMEVYDGKYRVACSNNGNHFWAQLDYSKGFSDWWWLSHTDIHVPSEHTQEGKRYDAEMQFYHFFSVSGEDSKAGVPNQMGTVSVFMEAYEDADDYDKLNKVICQWRRVEEETRDQCGLSSIDDEYEGCTNYYRGRNRSRNLRNASGHQETTVGNDVFEETEVDWSELMEDVLQQDELSHGRQLDDYDDVGPWSNYFALDDVKTEYYFRYSGTQTIPPCYGRFEAGPNNRANTNHWRIMKDPLRISYRQLYELHRLLKERIAPRTDATRPCQRDSAARDYYGRENWVNVTRPLQSTQNAHFMVFCECQWKSEFEEDNEWCDDDDQKSRLYDHPYNFDHDGF